MIIPGIESKTVRAGVVGAGHMGRYHVGAYSEIMNVDIAGVADVVEERAREAAYQYRTVPYADYRDLFGKVDVVSVAVPTALHFQTACDFLRNGVHVLVEKPIAPTVAEAEAMFDLAIKNNLALCIGHVERFNGAVMELQKIVENPILIEFRRMGPFTGRGIGDGVVLDLMIHDLDILLNLTSSPVKRLSAAGSTVLSKAEDVVSVQIEFESGCLATLLASRISEHKARTMSITQKGGYIQLDYTNQEILIHRQASSSYVRTPSSLKYRQESLIERIYVHKENPLKSELVHFIQCATDPAARAEIDPERDLGSLKISLQVLDIVRKGA